MDILRRQQKFETIFHLIWHLLIKHQIKWEIVSNFVVFLENLNFTYPILYNIYQLVVKGNRSKSVSFGVVLTHPDANKKQNSIISETTSVDLTDGNKMSSSLKRKSIIKLPYKNTTTAEKKDNSETPNPTATAAPETSKKDGNHDKIQAEQSKKTTNKKPAKVFKAHNSSTLVFQHKICLIY